MWLQGTKVTVDCHVCAGCVSLRVQLHSGKAACALGADQEHEGEMQLAYIGNERLHYTPAQLKKLTDREFELSTPRFSNRKLTRLEESIYDTSKASMPRELLKHGSLAADAYQAACECKHYSYTTADKVLGDGSCNEAEQFNMTSEAICVAHHITPHKCNCTWMLQVSPAHSAYHG